MKTYYITKYWVTRGILREDCEPSSSAPEAFVEDAPPIDVTRIVAAAASSWNSTPWTPWLYVFYRERGEALRP